MTHKAFRRLQKEMDDAGLMTSIQRIGKPPRRTYEVLVNGAIVISYKTRRSAKRYVERIFEEKLALSAI